MALTTTTLSAAVGADDTQISVTSATGVAANAIIQIDQEFMRVVNSYTSGTIIPVLRSVVDNGTYSASHPSGANVQVGLATDFSSPSATVITAYPLSALRRKRTEYAASGAIALPGAGEDLDVVLIGTSVLTMTVVAPTADIDGSILSIFGNGKSASTVAVAGNAGVGNAGSGYRTVTFQTGGQVGVMFKACNAEWVLMGTPITGTTTAISVAIS